MCFRCSAYIRHRCINSFFVSSASCSAFSTILMKINFADSKKKENHYQHESL
ncbi:hypothetical protein MtrunA17_Chr3g0119961 [Medicago truncatula]|uniref:Uncharacterized protein n=1 Tax=Medicago truncatula TaxID=3880 RepID=A0A396ITV9_MEDTR|nr:hypothetical protein MtrunA17_Chr3g0119961 [Medicago truncatula]